MQTARLALVLALAAALTACGARKDVRGNYLSETQLAAISVGKTDRETVLRVLGPPSTEGTFDQHVWYYIGRHTESWAFLKPEILDQKIVAIYFNDKGVVELMQKYGEADTRHVEIVERETPTSGNKIGFFEQIFSNLGALGGGSQEF